MRWNCPHCGVNLAISDERMGAGWSFSRCFKCGGFALIRKAEVNVVKVDRAPTGENVLLPEASERPTSMLSEGAMQNLERFRRNSAERTIPTPAPSPMTAPIASAIPQPAPAPKTASHPIPKIPQMLPELPIEARSSQRKILASAISAAAIATVGSGIYLFIQGQAIWEKSRARTAAAQKSAIETTSFKSPEVVAPPTLVTDQVHNQAMAPVRAPAPANSLPQVISKAISNQQLSALIVKPNSDTVELRSGPGQVYQKIGVASANERYLVTDWSNQWFKIQLPNSVGKNSNQGAQSAWVRTDAVQMVSQEN